MAQSLPFKFNFTVHAETQEEATQKLQAASDLLQSLSTKEIVKIASVVKNDPIKTALAKKYLGLK